MFSKSTGCTLRGQVPTERGREAAPPPQHPVGPDFQRGLPVNTAAACFTVSLLLVAGVIAAKAPPKPRRETVEDIKTTPDDERTIEWPTASHLQRESTSAADSSPPTVRVPPYMRELAHAA